MSLIPDSPVNPYIGPRAFRTGERLYGRDREASQLTNLIIAERVVLLHSPSGAGKTSLILAAVIPRLLKMKFRVMPAMRVNLDPAGTPGVGIDCNRYVFSALLSLEEGLPIEQRQPVERLARMSLPEYLAQRPGHAGGAGVEVMIFDQFEEVLTLNPTDLPAKHEFFGQLGEALAEPRRWALFSMREDHVVALDPYALPVPGRFSNRYRLDLLGQEAAREAMQQPARLAGIEFEDAVAARLVDDLRRVRVQRPDGTLEAMLGPHVEPVQLQVVCYRLWETPRADPGRISERELASFGDVDQSLVDPSLQEYYAQRVAETAASTGVSERSIREWFDRQLITQQDLRGTVLMGKDHSAGLENRAIGPLVNAYLVRAEKRGGATWFELSHDRLIGPVRADNATWFAANLSLLQRRADLWHQQGRPESLLLRGPELAQAERWAGGAGATLLPAEVEFLTGSREQEARALRLKRRNRAIAILGVMATLLAILALLAFAQAARQRDSAERQARLARSGQLAAQSQAVIQEFPLRSLLLAVEAVHTPLDNEARPVSAEEALRAALRDPHGLPLFGNEDWINALVFSPDGRWLATAGADKTARLWPINTTRPMTGPVTASLILAGHARSVTSLAFSPDGRWLATGSQDGQVRLWDVRDARAPGRAENAVVLAGRHSDVFALGFSRDGRWLAAGSLDGAVLLWDMRAPDPSVPPITLAGHTGSIWALAFSPDGRWLATGSGDQTTRLWDLQNPDPAAQPHVFFGHEGLITVVAFSPDGHWLATASRDGTARLWDLQAGGLASPPVVLRGHEDWINAMTFSADGHWLATGSGDRTARVWDLRAADQAAHPIILRGHRSPIHSLAFSPDGHWLATGSGDRTTRLWNMFAPDAAADPRVLRGHEGQVKAVAFSPDGRWLATGGEERTARLWALATTDPDTSPEVLAGHHDPVNTLAFSPDGQWLASGGGNKTGNSTDNTVRVWNRSAVDRTEVASPLELNGHTGWIQALSFSAEGRWLASGSGDGTVRLWDMRAISSDTQALILRGHTAWVSALAFSRDGRWLATGSQDQTARLWNLSAADPAAAPLILRGHEERVNALAFSPDGRWLATATGYAARLWDMSATDPAAHPLILSGHQDFITAVAFSPDGRWLATGSGDKTARLWDLRATRPADNPLVLTGHAGRINMLAFSPDGRWLATGGEDGTVRLWNLRSANPAEAAQILPSHSKAVVTLAFSAGAHWLASGGEDGQALLWNLQAVAPGIEPITLIGHDGGISALAFSPDGRWLATGGRDHTIRLWLIGVDDLIDIACRSAGRNFTGEEWRLYFHDMPYHKTCSQWPGLAQGN